MLTHAWLAIAVAVAVTRHGLYEIDRLFNRTLVYAVLTALLAGTYALVALLAGQLAGGSAFAASVGTLAAALAFRPLRDRLQAIVDRRFAAPARRGRAAAARLPRRRARRPGGAGGRRRGAARSRSTTRPPRSSSACPRPAPTPTAAATCSTRCPTTGARARRSAARPRVGVLLHDPALERRPDLLHAVLDAAAVAVELGRLRVELRLQLAEVESSRARIAQAGYAERRRLERDLHDGAQQRLVTLGIVLRRLQRSLPGEAKILAPALDAAVDEVAATIADLRTIAAGVRPPRLDEGLTAALEDLARGAAVPVELEASGDRAPPEVEAVAYFIACEALTNAVKHGVAVARDRADRRAADDVLRLVVADDGVGGAAPASGRGLRGDGRPRRRPGRDARAREPARRGHADRGGAAVRVVIAEDTVLLREGLAGLLEDAGHEVVGRAGDAEALLALVGEHAPELAVVDVRMPPDYDDEGTRAAAEIRRSHPGTAVLVLSQHIETRHVVELVSAGGGFGYLLKDRVLDVDDFLDAARRVSEGGSALDPQVVATLIERPKRESALDELTPREREVLSLMAEGRRTPASRGSCG